MDAIPREVARDPGELGVNWSRRVSAGKRDPKLIAFGQGGPRVTENKLRCVMHEVLGADDFALHAGALDRAMRQTALLEITLMIFFRAIEGRRRFDESHDWIFKP